jgi:hypothetical protein
MKPGVKVQQATVPPGSTIRVISFHQDGWSNQWADVPAVTRSTEFAEKNGRSDESAVSYCLDRHSRSVRVELGVMT